MSRLISVVPSFVLHGISMPAGTTFNALSGLIQTTDFVMSVYFMSSGCICHVIGVIGFDIEYTLAQFTCGKLGTCELWRCFRIGCPVMTKTMDIIAKCTSVTKGLIHTILSSHFL